MINFDLFTKYSTHIETGMYETGYIDTQQLTLEEVALLPIDDECRECDHVEATKYCDELSDNLINKHFKNWEPLESEIVATKITQKPLPYYGFHQDMHPPRKNLETDKIRLRLLLPSFCGTEYIQNERIEYDPGVEYEKGQWNEMLKIWSVGKKVLELCDYQMVLFGYQFVHSTPRHSRLLDRGMVGKVRHVYVRDIEVTNDD